jgi:hypothetical protein
MDGGTMDMASELMQIPLKYCMKKNPVMPSINAKSQKDKHIRPENKDNLDSRKNEEQDIKADDITHNKKETLLSDKKVNL